MANDALYSLGTAAHVQIGQLDTLVISEEDNYIFSLPITYGTTKLVSSDTSDIGGGLTYIFSSTQSVDAFGNITMPFGTYAALRVTQVEETKAYMNGSLIFQYVQPSFTWIAKDGGIFEADIDTATGTSGVVSLTNVSITQFVITPLAVDESRLNAPSAFVLYQNFSNPFNPSTKIRFAVPSFNADKTNNLVTLRVYNILGNEVATLVNEEKSTGTYEVEFNSVDSQMNELPSGIYFYKLTAGGFVQTRKMVLLK